MYTDKDLKPKQSKKSRLLYILLVTVVLIITIIIGAKMLYKKSLDKYYKNCNELFTIPDIDKGFIPQGIAFNKENNMYLLTGYMGNGSASPIYLIDADSKSVKKVLMYTPENKPFKGHAGGLSVIGNEVYVAGSTDYCMYVFSLDDLLNAENNSTLSYKNIVSLKNDDDFLRVSFTSENNGILFAGEFHKSPIFYTHESHEISTGDGVQNAYLFGFKVNENTAEPAIVYSIPDKVQGACFHDNKVYLSISHGAAPAEICEYDLKKIESSQTHTVLGKEIPLYVLDDSNVSHKYKIPPMSEEIIFVNDDLVTLHECASNRYIFGKFISAKKTYSINLQKMF